MRFIAIYAIQPWIVVWGAIPFRFSYDTSFWIACLSAKDSLVMDLKCARPIYSLDLDSSTDKKAFYKIPWKPSHVRAFE